MNTIEKENLILNEITKNHMMSIKEKLTIFNNKAVTFEESLNNEILVLSNEYKDLYN